MDGQIIETQKQFQIEPTSHLDVAPGHWQERFKQLVEAQAQADDKPTQELSLALLVMDALAFEILEVQETAREELALRLLRAGSLNWLTRKAITEAGKELVNKIGASKSKQKQQPEPAPINLTHPPLPMVASSTLAKASVSKPNSMPPILDETIRKLASHLRQTIGFNPVSPSGQWVHLPLKEFDAHLARLTDGKGSIEVCEILGIDKLSNEACRRYKFAGKLEIAQQLSVALLVVVTDYPGQFRLQLEPKPAQSAKVST